MELVTHGSLRAAQLVWRPAHGGVVLTVVCKATFALRPGVAPLAPSPLPVAEADTFGEGGGALLVASDLVPLKKQPEVLLTGHAYAPRGERVSSFVARLAVGEIDKAIRVEGDRTFGLDGQLTDPAPFVRMPLVWQRAAGGPDTSNPVGRAIGTYAQADPYGRVVAPNLLPLGFHLQSRNDVVPIVGFGPIAPLWPSRARCLHRHAAGWDPARWHERPLPDDIDLAYFNAAPPDQRRAAPFGEESLHLENLHPLFADLTTRLAPITPTATVERGKGSETLQLRCDTLSIDTNRGLATLVWRGHVVLERPDQAGRIVVSHAEAGESAVPSRTAKPPVFDHTRATDFHEQAASTLPFPDGAGEGAVSAGATPFSAASSLDGAAPPANPLLSGETLPIDPLFGGTMAFGFANAVPAVPFPGSRDSAPPREPGSDSGAGLPFASPAPPPAVFAPIPVPVPAPPPPLMALSALPPSPPLDVPAALSPAPLVAPPEMLGSLQPSGPPPAEPSRGAEPDDGSAATPVDPLAAYPIERCAAITASIARRRAETAQILEANDLDPPAWESLDRRWKEAISEQTGRGETELLAAFDEAYVAQLEKERGPITVQEYARLVVATERGKLPETLAAMTLPRGAMIRIERVWMKRTETDEALEKDARQAVKAARGK